MEAAKLKKVECLMAKARKSISSYCSEDCRAYCCRKGCLNISSKEIKSFKVITDGTRFINMKNGNYKLFLSPGCPNLDEKFQCISHKSKDRPKMCKEFPILFKNNSVYFCKDCPAVADNKFYSYEAKFLQMGINCLYF